jgi:DNA-binding transcriptional LysR family regulator
VTAAWKSPARATPAWLAAQPLILNDAGTRLSRLTAEWFAAGGQHPRARIELNYNDAIKSLVAAGYGAALLPHEASAPPPEARVRMLPLRPALWRPLGLAHRSGDTDGPTQHVLRALTDLQQG